MQEDKFCQSCPEKQKCETLRRGRQLECKKRGQIKRLQIWDEEN
jgi:hypothetical protein